MFSNTLGLCSSLNMRDQVLYSFKTGGKFIVLCILIFVLGSRLEDKRFWTACFYFQNLRKMNIL
jgi:hypothetical protein